MGLGGKEERFVAVLIVKVTTGCNSRCRYCAPAIRGPVNEQGSMTADTLDLLFRSIDRFLKEHYNQRIEILWHGGEPLLMGHAFFDNVSAIQSRRCPDVVKRIRHGIETNLLLMTTETAYALQSLGIRRIGTSFDPLPGIRGSGRAADNESYRRRFLEAVGILDHSGIAWDILMVVNGYSLEKGPTIFSYLTNLKPNGSIVFSPLLALHEQADDIKLTPPDYIEFLASIFPIWRKRRYALPSIEPFTSLSEAVKNNGHDDHGGDDTTPAAALLVGPRGGLYYSGTIRDVNDRPKWGSLDTIPLYEALWHSRTLYTSDIRARRAINGCATCQFYRFCLSGAIQDTFSQNEILNGPCRWCRTRGAFLERHLLT